MSEIDPPRELKPITAEVVCTKVILSILPIVQIAIGAVYHHECPKQHYIPIYLEVMGLYGLLIIGLSLMSYCNTVKPFTVAVYCLMVLFFVCWFITGNVWIYSIYEPNYNKTITDVDPYCNKTLYLFAFWITNVHYIQIGLLSCCFCCSIFR